MMGPTLRRLAAVVPAAIALAGCGPQSTVRCGMHSLTTDKYTVAYQSTPRPDRAARPLGSRVYARAPHYAISLSNPLAHTCSDVVVNKQLDLQRRDDANFLFTEINEYYTAGGRLIATRRQDITDQIPRSGYYSASDALAIPDGAPPGKYRMRSKLLLTHKTTNRKFLLAKADAWLHIAAPD